MHCYYEASFWETSKNRRCITLLSIIIYIYFLKYFDISSKSDWFHVKNVISETKSHQITYDLYFYLILLHKC